MLFLRSVPKGFALCIVVFFQIASLYSQNIDSLKTVVVESSGNEKANALYQLSTHHISKNDSLALDFINRAIEEITNDDKLKGKARFHRGMVYRSKGNDILTIRDIKEASEILKDVDTLGTADALYWLSRIHRRKGRFPEALNFGFGELEARILINDSSQIAAAMFDIGYTYDRMGEYHQAIDWHKKALNYYSFSDSKAIQAWGTGLIGIAYDELGQFDSALYYNKKAIEAFKAN